MTENNEKIREIEAKSLESERDILVIAKAKAQKSVNGDPSAPNLAALEKATKMLLDYDARKAPAAEPSFSNRIEALAWLQRQGYKIAKSKLYQDCKRGLLKLQDDGSVFEADLKKYTRKVGLNQLSKTPDVDPGDLQVKKTQAELDKLRTQNRLLQHQLDEKQRKYVSRDDFEMEFAAKIAILKSGLEYEIHSSAPDLIALILKSDPESIQQKLINKRQQDLDRQFNDFANIKKFQVVFAETAEITEAVEG